MRSNYRPSKFKVPLKSFRNTPKNYQRTQTANLQMNQKLVRQKNMLWRLTSHHRTSNQSRQVLQTALSTLLPIAPVQSYRCHLFRRSCMLPVKTFEQTICQNNISTSSIEQLMIYTRLRRKTQGL
jgi:hypothetical protein